METILAVVAGAGIGFFLGEQYILWKMKNGAILPINPYALPLKETARDLSTTMSPLGSKLKKIKVEEEGAVGVIKDRDKPKEPQYI